MTTPRRAPPPRRSWPRPATTTDASAFVESVDARFDKNAKRVEYLLSKGYALRADALFDELRAGAKGNEEFEARAVRSPTR